MKAQPIMSAEAAGSALLWKLGASLGAGVLGGAIMAAVDPPSTRRELFAQASVAGVCSMVFGPIAVRMADHYVSFLNLSNATTTDYLEVGVPIYFLVGALSWGLFGMIAKLRKIIADKGAEALARKFGVEPK